MASPLSSSFLTISIILFICFLSLSSSSVNGLPGGKFPVKDVKTNKEIQKVGKYAVDEYNRKFGKALIFKEVVEAQKQVIAGFKYFLKISAIENGKPNLYDALVILLASTRPPTYSLVSFNPSP
ncbi:hypothetical protein MKW92_032799 [Papaver armeniacum]|nr:hypothetical protein MKW92_032799 [Papaver armeniacum]